LSYFAAKIFNGTMDAQEQQTKLGKIIKQLRLEKGLTHSDLAEAIEKNPEYIARIEAGTCDLYLTEIGGLARKLKTPISQLFL
jgi:transcriptional regulator with XRE-family HTH domain